MSASAARRARRAAARDARRGFPRVHMDGLDDVPPELEPTVAALREYLNRQGPPNADPSGFVLLAHDLEGEPLVGLVDRQEMALTLLCGGDSDLARKLAEPVPSGSITLLAVARGGRCFRMRARWVPLAAEINCHGGTA